MKKVLLTILLIIQCSLLGATIINIPADYSDIQDGIDAAVDGDTILVQPGTYEENIEIENKILTLGSLFLTTQDSSYIEQTIIDGDHQISSVTIEDCMSGFTTVCGFKIINGVGTYEVVRKGGGIFVDNSLVIITDNIISDNVAGMGAGIFSKHSEVYIHDNIISDNRGPGTGNKDFWGGGICCDSVYTADIRRCDIYGNGIRIGGGMMLMATGFIVEECKVHDNEAYQGGAGGLDIQKGSYGSVVNCEISDNEAIYAGGGFFANNSEIKFCDVLFSGNSTPYGGGGGWLEGRVNVSFTNCTFVNNTSPGSGSVGGLVCGQTGFDVGFYNITNCIFYNNSPYQLKQGNGNIVIQYSDIEGGEDDIVTGEGTITWGDGNIEDDPLFVDVDPFPYELSFSSPCINAGTPDTTGLYLPLTDLAGNPRVLYDRIDMGAYECVNFSIDPGVSIVEGVSLYQNSPNPFRNGTEILFTVKDFSHIDDYSVSIYNTKGQIVRTFVGKSNTETTKIAWDGTDRFGKQTSPGVYLYKLEYGEQAVVRKMVKLH